ncbi:MAG: phosphate ABC transporter permease PstA [Erysipelotrichales bacterium]
MLNTKTGCFIVNCFIYLFTILTIFILIGITTFLLLGSMDVYSIEFLISMIPASLNTIFLLVIAILIATPISIMSAIHLEFYAKQTKFINFIKFSIDCLSGIPSIIFGLFGLSFFAYFIGLPKSILSGALTVAIVVVPIIIKNTQEAIKAVNEDYIQGSFALGASRFDTVKKIIIPESIDGIITGVILSIGRIIGETAAILFVAGTVDKVASSLFSPGVTLSNKLLLIIQEPTYSKLGISEAYAIALILIIVVVILNMIIKYVKYRFKKV